MARSDRTTSPATASRSPRRAAMFVADAAVPAVMLLAVFAVLVPLPSVLVDLLLAANLAVSALALVGALSARSPLEMSVFPTFLLGATLVRLVLNISTTRLILTKAAVEGDVAAGEVVRAFGEFVSGNSIVVGGVIFAIIAVIQFVVITAGSTRTGEVAARFALDALPGRQMAIDTEVQAGTITREQARAMRQDLQRHADFFANMDGASRFVRGEAVAGVVITLVNLVGGLAIGVAQHGMPVSRAVDVYSKLTIGDGLVSALPALLVSVATGLLISRSSQSMDLSRELRRQFVARPLMLVVTSAFLAVLACTRLPAAPLAGIAIGLAALAWQLGRSQAATTAGEGGLDSAPEGEAAAGGGASLAEELRVEDAVVVELGRGLVHLVAGADAPLPRRSAALRSSLAADLGIVLPKVIHRDEPLLDPQSYRIGIAGEPVVEGAIVPGRVFAIFEGGGGEIEGIEGPDPAGDRSGVWIAPRQTAQAVRCGATVLEAADVVARGIERAARRHADAILTRESVSRLIENVRAVQPAVVEGVVPEILPIPVVHRTLQLLVREGVPIRPLAGVLELLADHSSESNEPSMLAERVRQGLARTICRRARDSRGRLSIVRLAEGVLEGLVTAEGRTRKPDPKVVSEIRRALRTGGDDAGRVVVVPAAVRRPVRESLLRSLPGVTVLSEEEIAEEATVDVFATLGGEASKAA